MYYRFRPFHAVLAFIIIAVMLYAFIRFILPLLLVVAIIGGIFLLVRAALRSYKPSQPNYYQPTGQQPYQSGSYQQPYQPPQQQTYDPYMTPQPSYDAYQQGYQPPTTPTYQPSQPSYQYPPSQYEQPQAQYPQELPPQ